MHRYPNGHIDFALKLLGGDMIGVARVKLPVVKYKTVTTEGAGVMGGIDVPLGGMIDPMSVEIDFTSITDAVMELGGEGWHDVALYDAFQYFNKETGMEEIESDRIEMSIRAVETNLGTVATATAADASGKYSCRKYKVYKEGEVVLDIDQLNTKHVVNGVDNAEPIRKALGMM